MWVVTVWLTHRNGALALSPWPRSSRQAPPPSGGRRGTASARHAAVVAWVSQRTAGHPLFMLQVLDALHQRGLLRALALDEAEAPTLDLVMPPGLQQLLEAQLERLEPTAQQVLEAASVAGAEFAVASVAGGLELAPAVIDGVCEGLARQGQFLTDAGLVDWPDGTLSGRYGFRHTLYQEVLYKRLGAAQRARLHRLIGMRHGVAYGETALQRATDLDLPPYERQMVYRRMSYLHLRQGTLPTAIALLEQAVAWSQDADIPKKENRTDVFSCPKL